jgi:Thiamine pyrophosphate enzyme, central domain
VTVTLGHQARLTRLFEEAGLDTTYGVGGNGWEVDHEVASVVAAIMASAHRRVHGTGAVAHLGGGRFVVGDPYSSDAVQLVIESTRDLDDLAPHLFGLLASPRAHRIEIDARFDPEGRTTEVNHERFPSPTWSPPDEEVLDRVRAAERPMLIAGPGVVAAGAVPDLRALAASADLGVINTWGAKGVFDWRSRHHWATVGLQARDLELGGVPESDLVILTGIDADELDVGFLDGRPTVDVAPVTLGPLAEQWSRPPGDGAMPVLRERLAAVAQQGWARSEAPWAPSQITRDYAEAIGGNGFVAADPGVAGYWVARTFATTRLGGAKVPARRAEAGSAIASVIVARLRRPRARALAVTDELSDLDHSLLDAAHRLGVPVQVEVWAADGRTWEKGGHAEHLREVVSIGTTRETIAADPKQLDEMIEAAGRVTAWDGLVHEIADGTSDKAGGSGS